MRPRPAHLGPGYGAQFQDRSVVEAYRHRGAFPEEVFLVLLGLLGPEQPRAVLDLGCGRGEIARALVAAVDRVDAVDISPAMIEAGRRLSGGDHPHLRWICASAETAPLDPPYALIAAGNSLHWMDWDALMPRLAGGLTATGTLAIVGVGNGSTPWDDGLHALIAAFSTNRDFQPYDLTHELTERGLFRLDGVRRADPGPYAQPVGEYVESFHSRNGFSRERMMPDAAAEFDQRLADLVAPHARDGLLHLTSTAQITWGRPLAPWWTSTASSSGPSPP